MDTLTAEDFSAARLRLKRSQQAWAAEQFGSAIADSDNFRAEPRSAAWTDPLDADDLGIESIGYPDGSVGSRVVV